MPLFTLINTGFFCGKVSILASPPSSYQHHFNSPLKGVEGETWSRGVLGPRVKTKCPLTTARASRIRAPSAREKYCKGRASETPAWLFITAGAERALTAKGTP